MTTRMLRCTACRTYTLKAKCPQCGQRAASPLPPKYSPEDRYGEYRRRLRELVEHESSAGTAAPASRGGEARRKGGS